jgi:hypothetical protein
VLVDGFPEPWVQDDSYRAPVGREATVLGAAGSQSLFSASIFYWISTWSAAQRRPGVCEDCFPGIGACVAQPDATGADLYLGGDLE